jgi:hypothetical protein
VIDRRFVFSVFLCACLFVGCTSAASPSPSPSLAPTLAASPSPSSAPTAVPVPAMTEIFTSTNYGYAVGYPAGWTVEPASSVWWPPTWQGSEDYSSFDFINGPPEHGKFRGASALAPEGVSIDEWIDQFMTGAAVGTCNPPRSTLPEFDIDGHAGRIRDLCAEEIEATVVVGRRAYFFSHLLGSGHARALFEAFAATIDLRPDDAIASPTPSGS